MKFNLKICYTKENVEHKNADFEGCVSVPDVRKWINDANRFIDIGGFIHNLDNVKFIIIEKVE